MSDAYIGEIRLFPYFKNTPPQGWMFCNGALLNMSDYQALFAVIGTIYGGDGITQFALPNLNGRVLVDQGTGAVDPKSTTPSPLTPRNPGQTGGSEGVVLTTAMIPPHDHTFSASTKPNTTDIPGPGLFFGSDTAPTFKRYVSPVPNPAPRIGTLNENTVSSAGGNASHSNLMAGMGLRYAICVTAGLFPMRP
ncbi:phage tail protein [Novispirillum itersonii]|uniref:phage tail protein n=1 Tax=Novispirillum itersonii TaxID=189 RepID=UPI00037CA966|nr:tail fiber protein [Novispirillum itersonii]